MNGTNPIVSIACHTYNHENYIREAIEGFLMQETTFPIELIIHDDASTDKTAEIVKNYAEKHPDLILPILQAENQLSKGKKIAICTYPKARGKYIAICEGDDYWTDPQKLQKQVDFLESNPDCSWCFHASENIYSDNKLSGFVNKPRYIPKNNKFTAKDLICAESGFFATASTMFRAPVLKNLPDWFFSAPIGDFLLALIASSKGDIGYIDDVMCVYRLFVPNSWSSNRIVNEADWNSKISIHKKQINYLEAFNKYSNYKFDSFLKQRIIRNKVRLLLYAIKLSSHKTTFSETISKIKTIDIPVNTKNLLYFIWILLFDTTKRLFIKTNVRDSKIKKYLN